MGQKVKEALVDSISDKGNSNTIIATVAVSESSVVCWFVICLFGFVKIFLRWFICASIMYKDTRQESIFIFKQIVVYIVI